MNTLTIDQLRAYLERREREEKLALEQAQMQGSEAEESSKPYYTRRYIRANARFDLCRELLAAIETGRLPE